MSRYLRCYPLIQNFHQISSGAVVHSAAMHRAVQAATESAS